MILLREYYIGASQKYLTIDMQVNPNLEGVYIKSLRLSNTGDFTDADESAKTFDAIISSSINEYTREKIDWDAHPTEIRIQIEVETFCLPFYLMAFAEDPEGAATTCSYKNPLQAITFNKYPFFKTLACMAKDLEGCDIPQPFMDFLLRLKALEASIAIGDVESVNTYFKWFALHIEEKVFVLPKPNPVYIGCGCH